MLCETCTSQRVFLFECIVKTITCVCAATCDDPLIQVRKRLKRRYWTRVRVVASFTRWGDVINEEDLAALAGRPTRLLTMALQDHDPRVIAVLGLARGAKGAGPLVSVIAKPLLWLCFLFSYDGTRHSSSAGIRGDENENVWDSAGYRAQGSGRVCE